MIRTPEDQKAYYSTLEERCQHFEAAINATTNLLWEIIKDFEGPMLGPIIARLNSLVVFLEAASESAPSSDNPCGNKEQ